MTDGMPAVACLWVQWCIAAQDKRLDHTMPDTILRLVNGRDEVAGCSEQAYPSITVAHARQLLLFDSDAATLQYSSEVCSLLHGPEILL